MTRLQEARYRQIVPLCYEALCFPIHDQSHSGTSKYLCRYFVAGATSHRCRSPRCYDGTQRTGTWPSLVEIRQSHDLAITSQLSLQCDPERKIWVNDENVVWILNNNELRLRICIVGHSGGVGHRGVDTTLNSNQSFCLWPDMEANVQTFCFSCLYCQVNDNCVIPCPPGESLNDTTCNEVVHFNFISMHPLSSKSHHTFAYVLIIKDDLSGFVELIRSIPSIILLWLMC